MEDFTRDADDPDYPDVWMRTFFEDDDARRDEEGTNVFFLAFT